MRSKRNVSLFIILILVFLSMPESPCCQESIKDSPNEKILEEALVKLAKSADLHESLQYEIQCFEHLKRLVYRGRKSPISFGFQSQDTIQLKHGILIVRDGQGFPQETRLKLNRKGDIALNRKGIPKEIELPPEFETIAEAYFHSQTSWFTAKNQQYLDFLILSEKDEDESRFLIQCPNPGELPIEFLDRDPPVLDWPSADAHCTARRSGQLCLDPESGEISLINFYQLKPTAQGCVWNFLSTWSIIEQNVIEESTGARFPSRTETKIALNNRETAIFKQLFVDCVFSKVTVTDTFTGIKVSD